MPTAKRSTRPNDETYLKIWEVEQRHTATRWTLTTFFLSVSFAIFGVSLRSEFPGIPMFVPQAAAAAIYWFTYMLFLRFNDYSNYLRGMLRKMERDGRTSLRIQTDYYNRAKKRRLSATSLLLLFGILYTLACIAISVLYLI